MIGNINRFRRVRSTGRTERDDDVDCSSSDLPLDKRLTFKASADEQWSFEGDERIYVNGVDIEEMVDEERDDIRFLCGVSRCLHHYQLFVWSKGGKGNSGFNAKVHALQDKVHGRLNNIYDNLTGGVNFELQSGEFWMNNINVRKAIRIFYQNPTEAARRYLISLRNNLALILSSHRPSKRYDGVREEVDALFHDINIALEYIPADAPPRLVDGRRSA